MIPTASTSSNNVGERQSLLLNTNLQDSAASTSRISSDASYEDNYKRARTLSPHTRDSLSDYSFDSILPSAHSFKRTHKIVSYISLLFCFALLGSLVAWKWKEGAIGWWELGLGASAWLTSQALKEGIFELFTFKSFSDGVVTRGSGLGIPTVIHSTVQEFLRLGGIILVVALLPDAVAPTILSSSSHSHTSMPFPPSIPPNTPRHPLPPLDALFFSALYFSLGWSFVEILFSSKQFWKYIRLYDDVLDEVSEFDEEEGRDWEGEEEIEGEEEQYILNGAGIMSRSTELAREGGGVDYGATSHTSSRLVTTESPVEHKSLQFLTNSAFERVVSGPLAREEEEAEAEARIRRIEREELEETLGLPLYAVPTFIVFVWRLDAVLLSVDLSLLLALPFRTTAPTLIFFPIWPTFIAATVIHITLSLLWTLGIKHFGIPAISYATLVTLVAALFAVLALWGSLE